MKCELCDLSGDSRSRFEAILVMSAIESVENREAGLTFLELQGSFVGWGQGGSRAQGLTGMGVLQRNGAMLRDVL